MSSLQFKRIRICSEAEQAAMELTFDPKRTLLWGPNGAGKSAVIKSVFRAIGAEPHGELPGWDYRAILALDFSFRGREFTSVRFQDLRGLFEGSELLGATTSDEEWNEIFSEAVDFQLRLLSREGQLQRASPAHFFLPFFVNQDGSFGSHWDTFDGIKKFQQSAVQTLEYFARVWPPKYFGIKAEEQGVKVKIAERRAEITTLQRTRLRLKKTQRALPVRLNQRDFQEEIQELTKQLLTLSKAQEDLRKHIIEDQDLEVSLTEQISMSEHALRVHEADFQFAARESIDKSEFICPTCNAKHPESFHMFLGLAEDARELNLLRERLVHMAASAKERLKRNRSKAIALKRDFSELNALLATKKGKFTFDDFLKSRSVLVADDQLASEERLVRKEIEAHERQLGEIKISLADLEKNHDAKAPLKLFRTKFAKALVRLEAPSPTGVSKWPLAKRPDASGSRHARSILAYYSALWHTMVTDGRLPAPIFVDSPNQGGQDRENLQKLIASVVRAVPAGSQVVLCHERYVEAFSDGKTIEFKKGSKLLDGATFKRLSRDMFQYLAVARANLAQVKDVDGGSEAESQPGPDAARQRVSSSGQRPNSEAKQRDLFEP